MDQYTGAAHRVTVSDHHPKPIEPGVSGVRSLNQVENFKEETYATR